MALDPSLVAGVPYGNRTALIDLAGTMELWFRDLAESAFRTVAAHFRVLPLGTPGREAWTLAVQQQFEAAADALGVAPPQDLSYDLDEPADWASFTFVLSQEMEKLRTAAGLA